MDNEARGSRTIDSKGNIVGKRYGVSRWDYPRKYECYHKECETPASILSAGCPGAPFAHNCCSFHKE